MTPRRCTACQLYRAEAQRLLEHPRGHVPHCGGDDEVAPRAGGGDTLPHRGAIGGGGKRQHKSGGGPARQTVACRPIYL